MNINPADLLEVLQDFSFAARYALALYCREKGLLAVRGAIPHWCASFGGSFFCTPECPKCRESEGDKALASNQPRVFTCPAGLLNVVIPVKELRKEGSYLLGGGVRDKNIDFGLLEKLIREKKINGVPLLKEWENLPVVLPDEMFQLAAKIHTVLPAVCGGGLYFHAFEKTVKLLKAVTGICPEIDRVFTVDEVFSLLAETVTVLFDVSRIGVVTPGGNDQEYILKGLMGFSQGGVKLDGRRFSKIFAQRPERKFVLRGREVYELFPGVHSERLTCFPMIVEKERMGCLVLFDVQLPPRYIALMEVLVDRVAYKLLRLKKEKERDLEASLAKECFRMLGILSQPRSKKELYKKILDLTTDFIQATKGSLMLVENSGESLSIKASKGMNPELARNMTVKMGQGIAGRVAKNGKPLLVHDIEQDKHIGMHNRPRFKTKSFLSSPLKLRGKVIGVLNFSDRLNGEAFAEAEMNFVTNFAPCASVMVENLDSLMRAKYMERLSATDPLTGLYNRRFLELRIEEELSLSMRKGLEMSLMMIDIDEFKKYNDLCGHLAGDRALQKIAHLLKISAREMDIVIRYGGEEFCILLPATSKKEARLVAERMRRTIENERFVHEENLPQKRLTVSIGIATFPEAGNAAKSLIHSADIALYQSKRQGRNQTVIFDPSLKKDPLSLATKSFTDQ